MTIELLHSIDLVFYIFLIGGFISLFLLLKILSKKNWYKFLLTIRFILYLIILFLLLNPVLNISYQSDRILNWNIFLDNSSSIKYHKTPSLNSIKSGYQEIRAKLLEKNISFNSFIFDNKIDLIQASNFNGDGLTTNYWKVFDLIVDSEKNLAGAIIISDGIITEGKNSVDDLINLKIPIHVIGIGERSELVDISIHSLDVPTVVLKGDKVDLKVTIQSLGNINERLSLSLYRESKLLGSKPIRLSGMGSKNEANFRFNAKEIGRQKFEVRVSSVKDEINIQNNRQYFSLLILKDKYKVALITGSPNKNTSPIKKIIKKNKRIKLDHYVRVRDQKFKPDIKNFWKSPYELIIFDNYPIKPPSSNFIRILGKKLITNQSALMHVTGPNQNNKSLNGINSILGITLIDSTQISEKVYWDFIKTNNSDIDYPPLEQSLFLIGESTTADSLAIFESGWPLWLRNNNNNFRSVIFATSELNVLYHFQDNENQNNLFNSILNTEVGWLLKTDASNENYFRLNKDSFHQGEMIKLTGTQPFDSPSFVNSINFTIVKDHEEKYYGDIDYNYERDRWEGEFRASKPGSYLYKLFMAESNQPFQTGTFKVLESQIELNQVYLNQDLLKNISKNTNGKYFHWDDRDELLKLISPKVRREFKADIIKLTESRFVLIMLIILLCIEWTLRRIKGLI